MNDISPPQREAPDSLMLYGFWYRALPGRQVRGNHLQKAMLLETPWPSDGIARAGLSPCMMPARTAACRFPMAFRWAAGGMQLSRLAV